VKNGGKRPDFRRFVSPTCRNYFAQIKKRFTFKPVFIGYGLKTGQGVYPGPILFLAKTVPFTIFPVREFYFSPPHAYKRRPPF
jgi:hypothetical protein